MKFSCIWISRIWSTFSLMFVCIMLFSLNVSASSSAEYDGLKVMVAMDQESYEAGDEITATITVVNTNTRPVTIINLEQLIPEGYVLSEDSQVATQNVEISPGQEISLQVSFVGEPPQPAENGEGGTFWDKLFYGETLGIPNIIWAVIVVIILIVFMLLT